jgi:hypothetical protein
MPSGGLPPLNPTGFDWLDPALSLSMPQLPADPHAVATIIR